ncbi:MAG: NYN domain-containing protein [Gemmatimonadales bacterium]
MNAPQRRPARGTEAPAHAPNAALLIDFDNVTLGIRSDLAKELRSLLNSDIIKGKVSVQRAYADWRRYPQYIVPLSESSVDLIFAPAFGTNKKNATDIRLAVDAVELVFTRPEIGTFILLSGDSDFSSLVLKLKEYGKYVIGVGIRESASDLLVQNCDEYFSYSDLAGLTKEADVRSAPGTPRDPWQLVAEAVARMVKDRDVMRADRLKQVMQDLDPNFDERNAGFNRFSKFMTEAGTRGVVKITKLENGQLEIAPAAGAVAAPTPPDGSEAATGERGARGGRRRGGRGRGRGASGGDESAAAPTAPTAGLAAPRSLTLAQGFDLLKDALAGLPTPAPHETVRQRMLALAGKEDPLLEAARFIRLLRQAHDAEVAEVRKVGDGAFDIAPFGSVGGPPARLDRPAQPASRVVEAVPAAPVAAPEPAPVASASAPLRFRRGSKTGLRPSAVPLVGVVAMDEESPAPPAEKRPAHGRTRGARVTAAPVAAPDPEAEAPKKPARRRGRSTKKAAS